MWGFWDGMGWDEEKGEGEAEKGKWQREYSIRSSGSNRYIVRASYHVYEVWLMIIKVK